jgi:hypothetical protein
VSVSILFTNNLYIDKFLRNYDNDSRRHKKIVSLVVLVSANNDVAGLTSAFVVRIKNRLDERFLIPLPFF